MTIKQLHKQLQKYIDDGLGDTPVVYGRESLISGVYGTLSKYYSDTSHFDPDTKVFKILEKHENVLDLYFSSLASYMDSFPQKTNPEITYDYSNATEAFKKIVEYYEQN